MCREPDKYMNLMCSFDCYHQLKELNAVVVKNTVISSASGKKQLTHGQLTGLRSGNSNNGNTHTHTHTCPHAHTHVVVKLPRTHTLAGTKENTGHTRLWWVMQRGRWGSALMSQTHPRQDGKAWRGTRKIKHHTVALNHVCTNQQPCDAIHLRVGWKEADKILC